MAKIPVLSFFTGGGFLDMGFEQAGFDVAFTNEFNEDICDMHDYAYTAWRASIGDPREARISFRGSIEDVNVNHIARTDPFGVIGGSPCPSFSIAGKQKGKDDPRGQLAWVYVEKIIALRPSFFLMENVPGLARTAKHSKFLYELRVKLRDAGYSTDVSILNALEHGAPQDRERMFMVGFRNDFLLEVPKPRGFDVLAGGWFPYPAPTHPGAKDRYPWPKTSPFGATPPRPDVPIELTISPLLQGLYAVANSTEHFQPYSRKFTEVPEGDTHRKSYKRPHRYRYSPTAAYGNNEVHFHPWLPRRMSVRECLRIQTLPDSYVLPTEKPLSIKFRMIGNGVPVLLARAMASSMMRFLASSTRASCSPSATPPSEEAVRGVEWAAAGC